MTSQRSKLIFHIALGIALYLFLFSSFALFHAYANDELTDPHGCQIGLWLQHGHATLLSLLLLSAAIVCLFYRRCTIDTPLYNLYINPLTARAPPFFSHV